MYSSQHRAIAAGQAGDPGGGERGEHATPVRLSPIDNARAYEVRVSYGTNGWQAAGVFTQARRVVLQNLTPGTSYNIQVRAVGGSTGYSDWSDPVSHMAL